MVLTDKLRILGQDFIELYVHRTENAGAAGPDIETHASAGTP
jgi:hypothetical protein